MSMVKMIKRTSLKQRKADRIPILIVEDDADHWLIIRSALAQCFPEVEPVWVNNAAQAVTYLEQASSSKRKLPWLILLELHLPRPQDGWLLIELIKDNPTARHIPLIILSHSKEPNEIARSYSLDIASYLVKPTTYHQWLKCFYSFRKYWWEVVTLPRPSITFVEEPITAQLMLDTVSL
jgi:CheY-like chemotaxis protein